MVADVDNIKKHKVEWEIAVPILSNKHIMKQIFWVFQISIGVVLAIIFLIQALDPYTRVDLDFIVFLAKLYFILLAVFGVCLVLGTLITMGVGYQYIFSIDSQGIMESPGRKQGKKNVIVNTLLVILGFLTKRPGIAGAGVLAQTRQKSYICWRDINKIEVDSKGRTLLLKRNSRTLMMVFCTRENFEVVRDIIMANTNIE